MPAHGSGGGASIHVPVQFAAIGIQMSPDIDQIQDTHVFALSASPWTSITLNVRSARFQTGGLRDASSSHSSTSTGSCVQAARLASKWPYLFAIGVSIGQRRAWYGSFRSRRSYSRTVSAIRAASRRVNAVGSLPSSAKFTPCQFDALEYC